MLDVRVFFFFFFSSPFLIQGINHEDSKNTRQLSNKILIHGGLDLFNVSSMFKLNNYSYLKKVR